MPLLMCSQSRSSPSRVRFRINIVSKNVQDVPAASVINTQRVEVPLMCHCVQNHQGGWQMAPIPWAINAGPVIHQCCPCPPPTPEANSAARFFICGRLISLSPRFRNLCVFLHNFFDCFLVLSPRFHNPHPDNLQR